MYSIIPCSVADFSNISFTGVVEPPPDVSFRKSVVEFVADISSNEDGDVVPMPTLPEELMYNLSTSLVLMVASLLAPSTSR